MAAQCRTHFPPERPPARTKPAQLPTPVSSCPPVLSSTTAPTSHPGTYSSAPGKITPTPVTTNRHPVVYFLHLLLPSPMAVGGTTTLPKPEPYFPPSDQPRHPPKPSSFPYILPFGATLGKLTSCTQFSSPKQTPSILREIIIPLLLS